jgi:hypothetical protein
LSGRGCVKSHEAERRSQHSGFDHRLSKIIRAESGPFPKSLALWWRRHEECSNAEKEFTRERANHSSSRVTPEPLRERVRLFRSKKIGRNFNVPRWRAEYFDRANGETPERSVIIAADNEAVALEEVRARMAPTCSRAEVTKLDPDSKTRRP